MMTPAEALAAIRKIKKTVQDAAQACELAESAFVELEQTQGQINVLNAQIPPLDREYNRLLDEAESLKISVYRLRGEKEQLEQLVDEIVTEAGVGREMAQLAERWKSIEDKLGKTR